MATAGAPDDVARGVHRFFEGDAGKFERDRWLARPEAEYDRDRTWEVLKDWLAKVQVLAPRPRVLELGCGTGHWGRRIAQAAAVDYTGVDFSNAMLAQARAAAAGVPSSTFEWVSADMERFDARGGTYHLVLAIHSLEYLPGTAAFFTALQTLLAPNGVAIVITKNRSAFVWRGMKRLLAAIRKDPLPFQNSYRRASLRRGIEQAGLACVEEGVLSLRPPTYLGDLNDAFASGMPTRLTRPLLARLAPLEKKARRHRLATAFGWRLYAVARRGT